MSEPASAFQSDAFQLDLGAGGFQSAVPAVVGGAHWAPRAFHEAHFRVGHWVGEEPLAPPTVVQRRHWATRAFHPTHWGQTHWSEGEAAPPGGGEILGDVEIVIDADAEFTYRSGLGPRPPTSVWIPRRQRRALHAEIEGDVALVVDTDAEIVFRPAPLRRQRIPAEVECVIHADADWRYLNYVADVLLPEEEELLALL